VGSVVTVAVTPAPRAMMHEPPEGQSPSSLHSVPVSVVQTLSGTV
jgi:hypothetical protein